MIRELKKSEIGMACKLILAVYNESEYVNDTIEGRKLFNEIYSSEKHLTNMIDNNALTMYGYFDGDTLLGVTSLDIDDTIMHLFVDMAHNGQGIAKALLNHVYEIERGRGKKRVRIDSSKYALSFYKAQGFKESCEEINESGMVYTPMYLDL